MNQGITAALVTSDFFQNFIPLKMQSMKFAEQIATHLTPEWRKQYITYAEIKTALYDLDAKGPPIDQPEEREVYWAIHGQEILNMIDSELTKVNLFFSMKMAEAQRTFHELHHDVETFKTISKANNVEQKGSPQHLQLQQSAGKHLKTLKQLKLAFSEFYLMLVLIQNYQQLNQTGFLKILKKYDKVTQTNQGRLMIDQKVTSSSFVTNKDIDTLLAKTENVVINELENGNKAAAKKRLRVQPMSEKENAWTTFRLGLYLGCFIILCMLIAAKVYDKVKDYNEEQLELVRALHAGEEWLTDNERPWVAVRLFRGFLLIFLNCWFIGLNVYGWQRAGVNHVLIFEINPRDHLTYQQLLEFASFFCILWALSATGYLFAPDYGVPPLIFPLLMFIVFLAWFLNPSKAPCWHRSSRYWLINKFRICLCAPFYPVVFADFWLADQVNTLITSVVDVGYFICFYTTQVEYFKPGRPFIDFKVYGHLNGTLLNPPADQDYCSGTAIWRPLISMTPAVIRVLQCLRRYKDTRDVHPHLTNGGKFTSSILVTVTGYAFALYAQENRHLTFFTNPLSYLWIVAYIVSFCYMYGWDLLMDWSLMRPQHGFLREELGYSQKWYYYYAIVSDGLLRLSWTFNVTLAAAGLSRAGRDSASFILFEPDVGLWVTGLLECFRRFVWNFFRLENEHVNNCGQFRAIRDITLKPIRKGALDTLTSKMDDEDGVTHRGKELVNAKSMKNPAKYRAKLELMLGGIRRLRSPRERKLRAAMKTTKPKIKRVASDGALNALSSLALNTALVHGHLNTTMDMSLTDEGLPIAMTEIPHKRSIQMSHKRHASE